jgi:hypothetical protein
VQVHYLGRYVDVVELCGSAGVFHPYPRNIYGVNDGPGVCRHYRVDPRTAGTDEQSLALEVGNSRDREGFGNAPQRRIFPHFVKKHPFPLGQGFALASVHRCCPLRWRLLYL